MTTKAQIISDALDIGVPESLLTGSKTQILAAIAGWENAQLEASADTAAAFDPDPEIDLTELDPDASQTRPRDTPLGPWMLLGVALFG